ncbi:MAG: hypothetical protein KIT84_18280 [Labilithrix sp.]|nr:hypothetical protein [Labilithrix sp.]MCW5812981.1 hypothetical protein [Labilithrix sp.]
MRAFAFAVLVFGAALGACRVEEVATGSPRSVAGTGAIPLATARSYLDEYAGLAAADGGKLWGRSLAGPFLFVDPGTRQVVANERDAQGKLAARDGVFVGRLGDDDMIANTSVEWSGTRWTMVMWDDDFAEDAARRRRLMLHEAFHRVQPALGLVAAGEPNEHLDTRDGRYWLQLEWNALETAIASPPVAAAAIADALAFRAARRRAFPEAAARENALEIHEGLAEYTGARASGTSEADAVAAVRARRQATSGFVRSFAYVSGPLYGYLLDRTGDDWRRGLGKDSDLGALLARRARVDVPASGDAERWGGIALGTAEDTREAERQVRLRAWRVALVEGPVLAIDLTTVTSGSFDPRKVHAFASNQVVYTSRTLVAPWGKLTMEDGAMLEDRASARAFVSLSRRDWTLRLEPGWTLAPGERSGDRRIVRR